MKFYNSQSRQLEVFTPQDPNRLTLYVCGPTVYGPAHIGNARPALVFDQLFRLLRYRYRPEAVLYSRNITDIDDKIIQAANDKGVSIQDITEPALAAYHADLKALNCLPPTEEPKATNYIPVMSNMIAKLLNSEHAYMVDGQVFFHVPSNPYPGLANHTNLDSGNRVEVDSRKRDPRDFVLWKPAKPNEPSWWTPWGEGRPGWHIECSAMIERTLGLTIDIHGGGQDLRFPHHEAECAQSQCLHDGAPLANLWLHNGLLTINGEKMSKSRGNVVMLNDLFESFPAESIRYYFLKSNYRSPMDFTMEGLTQAHRALSGLYDSLYRYDEVNYAEDTHVPDVVIAALENDLNTTLALTEIHQLADQLEQNGSAVNKARLLKAGQFMGLFNHTPYQWRTLGVDKEAVEVLIGARQTARLVKDWQEADKIRQQLLNMGITLADGVHGTEWRRT